MLVGSKKKISSSQSIFGNISKKIQEKQKFGIQKAKHIVNFELGVTENALNRIGVRSKRLSIPMVYCREKKPSLPPSDILFHAASKVEESSFIVLHHARLMWKRKTGFTKHQWQFHNKNNHWLIDAFSEFITCNPNSTPRLFLVEYGPDVSVTKELIFNLGIEKYVTWLPKMKRKEILWLIERVSIVSGEFYEIKKMIWGGTGWEALASGKPFLQAFHFSDGEFEKLYGYPPHLF